MSTVVFPRHEYPELEEIAKLIYREREAGREPTKLQVTLDQRRELTRRWHHTQRDNAYRTDEELDQNPVVRAWGLEIVVK